MNAIDKSPIYCLKSLIRFLGFKKVRLLYVLDNLDGYHFRYSRYSFFKKYSDDQCRSVTRNIKGLIDTFKNPSELGMSGLCVLMICRRYVYQYLRGSVDPSLPTEDDSSVFQLKSPNENDIVASRMQLFNYALESVAQEQPGKIRQWDPALKDLKAVFNVREISETYKESSLYVHPALEAIRLLSHQGYRSFVHFISSLRINYKDYDVFDRLLSRQLITLLILYMNNLKKRYSQYVGHFPNMFLNDCVVLSNKDFSEAHEKHSHTYWLKYLILKYIVQRKKVTVDEIYELFARNDGYEHHLVLHVLGSLCTSNEFRCADIDYSLPNIDIMNRYISPTTRGTYLVTPGRRLFPDHNVDFCFSFLYLQLVVDDFLLSLPLPWKDEVFKDLNYSYLYEKGTEYGYRASEMIDVKAHAVTYFIRILLASLVAESEKYPKIYAELKSIGILPDINKLILSLLDDLKQLDEAGKGRLDLNENIKRLWDKLVADESFDDFFNNYYKSNVSVSL